jgi:hypothetical protein
MLPCLWEFPRSLEAMEGLLGGEGSGVGYEAYGWGNIDRSTVCKMPPLL